MKKIARKIKQNGTILLLALICAIAIFYIKRNPDFFLTSILSLQEKQIIREQWRDAAYKTQSGDFEIFVADKYTGSLSKFQGILYINPDITLDTQDLTGQGDFQVQKTSENSFTVTVNNLSDINASEEIIGIPFSWQQKDIVLGESKGRTHSGLQKFSVGNLSEFMEHSE